MFILIVLILIKIFKIVDSLLLIIKSFKLLIFVELEVDVLRKLILLRSQSFILFKMNHLASYIHESSAYNQDFKSRHEMIKSMWHRDTRWSKHDSVILFYIIRLFVIIIMLIARFYRLHKSFYQSLIFFQQFRVFILSQWFFVAYMIVVNS